MSWFGYQPSGWFSRPFGQDAPTQAAHGPLVHSGRYTQSEIGADRGHPQRLERHPAPPTGSHIQSQTSIMPGNPLLQSRTPACMVVGTTPQRRATPERRHGRGSPGKRAQHTDPGSEAAGQDRWTGNLARTGQKETAPDSEAPEPPNPRKQRHRLEDTQRDQPPRRWQAPGADDTAPHAAGARGQRREAHLPAAFAGRRRTTPAPTGLGGGRPPWTQRSSSRT